MRRFTEDSRSSPVLPALQRPCRAATLYSEQSEKSLAMGWPKASILLPSTTFAELTTSSTSSEAKAVGAGIRPESLITGGLQPRNGLPQIHAEREVLDAMRDPG